MIKNCWNFIKGVGLGLWEMIRRIWPLALAVAVLCLIVGGICFLCNPDVHL